MIQKIKHQNKKHNAFTLIEMVIVLVVMGIMLMVTLFLSSDQIQKVKDKTVKESILAEMQTRYSRNLWSSSFAWVMYDTMDVTLYTEKNEIDFNYNPIGETTGVNNAFTDNFKILGIYPNYHFENKPTDESDIINLQYTPYKLSCKIWEEDKSHDNVVIIIRVNDSRDYCFEIKQKNCRLIEVSKEKCTTLKTFINN